MFNKLYDNPLDEMQAARIARCEQAVRALDLSTREEFQAEVYSRVNRVLNLGPRMTPVSVIGSEGPAEVGDITVNLSTLNQDAIDIAKNLVGMEDQAGEFYNLAAASQNALRQSIRESLYVSSGRRYIEPLINNRRLTRTSAAVDYNAGVATLPLLREDELRPESVRLGPASDVTSTTDTAALLDGSIETVFRAEGETLELIFEFSKAEILNRIRIELDDYEGLQLDELEATADGTYTEHLITSSVALNGASGKYTGDVILDFDPVHVKQLRLIIRDRVSTALIALRGISFFSRRYDKSGILTTTPILDPQGKVVFTAEAEFDAKLCGLVHQLSFNDGVSYQVIQPGDVLTVSGPYRYRCVFERRAAEFQKVAQPLIPPTLDPAQNPDYTIASVTSLSLGGAVMQRTIVLTNITGPIVLREVPLAGTLRVMEGAVKLSGNEYTFTENTLRFGNTKGGVTISYQTSALGSAAMNERQDYYTPRLREVRFERA